MPSLPGLVELGVGGEGGHPRGLQVTQPLSSTHDGTDTFLVSMKITHAPHLPNILIFLTFSRRGSQQAVVKGHKRGVTRYCIYPDPTSQMAMCSFLHLLTHSFIHSRAPSPGLILDIQEQVIKTHCLPWGAPSFWSGMGGGSPLLPLNLS